MKRATDRTTNALRALRRMWIARFASRGSPSGRSRPALPASGGLLDGDLGSGRSTREGAPTQESWARPGFPTRVL